MTVYTGNGWEIRCGRWQDSAPDRHDKHDPPRIDLLDFDGSVDVVISDPPYDEATHRGHQCGMRKRSQIEFDPVNPEKITGRLLQIARRWVVVFSSGVQVGKYADAAGGHWLMGGSFVRFGIWTKINPMPQWSGDRPASWGESLAIMHNRGTKLRWNGGGRPAAWGHGSAHGKDRHHQTPKPLPLMLDLVRDFSDPGELVWDPYCGSGTTGVACLRLGRRFLGHEMQPHYARLAAERLQAEERGLTLQDARRGQTSILDVLEDS